MLTETQKQQIAELAAARDAAYAAEEARLAAETAARRAANLIHWQPVLDAARAALPDWLTDGGRLEPNCPEADLAAIWVKQAAAGLLYSGHTAAVDLYDTHGDHILIIGLRRNGSAWTIENYAVIDGADYGRYNYTSLETALLRLPDEDEKRQETRAAREASEEITYAEYKAQEAERAAEIQAAQEAENARRAQFETEVSQLIAAAEQCLFQASHPNNTPSVASLHLSFSLTQSAIAIARILNDWRITAREYAQNPF